MIRKASCKSGQASSLYAGAKKNRYNLPIFFLTFTILMVFADLAVPVEARWYATLDGGYHHSSVGIKTDGTVVAWGSNSSGQSIVPPGLSQVIALAAGGLHSLALKSDGSVVAWGNNSSDQCGVPAGLDLRLRFKVPSKGISPGVLLLLLN